MCGCLGDVPLSWLCIGGGPHSVVGVASYLLVCVCACHLE